jgi:hypothetical protein
MIIVSVTNIALGYGLAIYLGHARASSAPFERATRSQRSVNQNPSEESRNDHTDDAFATSPVAPNLVASAAPPQPEPIPPKPELNDPVSKAVSPKAIEDDAPAAVVDEKPVAAAVETNDISTEEEVLSSLEEARAVIHGQPNPAKMVDSLSSKAKPEIPNPSTKESHAPAADVTENDLMQGIGAFQAQLKKQQELAKLHAATRKA